MQEYHTDSHLAEYNRIMKENEDFYRDVAKELGLSESVFWILYTLRTGYATVQKEICACMHQPKQTINSALKKMETDGYIEMTCGNDRRSREVLLTKKGISLCEKTVDLIIEIECAALDSLSEREQELFLSLFRKFTGLLKHGKRQKYKDERWSGKRTGKENP